ncbi:MAG: hypothetical protein QM784_00580 [Polyangiaceae bacterium]
MNRPNFRPSTLEKVQCLRKSYDVERLPVGGAYTVIPQQPARRLLLTPARHPKKAGQTRELGTP